MSLNYKIREQCGLNYLACAIIGQVDLFGRQDIVACIPILSGQF